MIRNYSSMLQPNPNNSIFFFCDDAVTIEAETTWRSFDRHCQMHLLVWILLNFLWIQGTVCQHWCGKWPSVDRTTSQCPKKIWANLPTHIHVTQHRRFFYKKVTRLGTVLSCVVFPKIGNQIKRVIYDNEQVFVMIYTWWVGDRREYMIHCY